MQADSSVWFTYGPDREVQYGVSEGISADMLTLYAKTEAEAVPVSAEVYPRSGRICLGMWQLPRR